MKNLILLFVFAIVYTGCSDNTGIVNLPEGESQLAFVTTNSSKTQFLSDDKLIEGVDGGEINIELMNEDIAVKGTLEFPELSFGSQEKIFVTVPESITGEAILDLNPTELNLEIPVFLTLKFTGLKIDEGDIIDFHYVDENGRMEAVEYGRLIIDYDNDWALVVNAKLYQLTKYGFTRRIIQ